MKILKQPYTLLFLVALLLLCIGLFLDGRGLQTLDIHLVDTYFIIAPFHFFAFLAAFYLCLGVLYLLTRKLLFSKVLSWLHVILTILFTVWIFYMVYQTNNGSPADLDFGSWGTYTVYNQGSHYWLWAIVLSPLLFIVNVIGGVIRRIRY
jgi:heme/copper-type cytochrome/quinol oxidase subunit 1